ncbi:MAG TPA: 3-carboxy-cis,cis-muconate cycloisomerase [Ktedonosporobacter sp.]|jgi:3-carboxy-cis,cis-muconate cycloisomerase|nr:3-carboxy-cis,cis-muconate cycloisomerase [Ktedonosporobacter sp.]
MAEQVEVLFSTPAMSATFSPEAHVRQMLAFEAALARAEARAGIIPHEAALSIAASCRVELFDIAALYREAATAGTPAIPLVRMLTEQVESSVGTRFSASDSGVGARNASRYVHWGATSQDAIDSALMLQMREGLDLLITDLLSICATCAALAEQHRHTIMIGRTLLQQALPITFGLKAARWLALLTRQVQALHEQRARTLAVQLGGAAGTLASLGEKGLQVVALLAEELNLPQPELPWHTERDRIAEIASTLGIVAGALAKIAGDLVLLAQTEVGEVTEASAPGKGGSSAMPQKRNPVDATGAIAAARLAIGVVPVILSAMTQEHERAAGGWQAEWAAIPDLFRFTAHAVERVRDAVAGLQIDPARMSANLDLTQGLVMAEALTMALSPHVGRPAAYRIVQEACQHATTSGIHLRQAAMQDARVRAILSPAEIDNALDPSQYLGSTDTLIDRALEAYRREQSLQG